MNRINKLFKEKKNILSIYLTAGFPKLNDTLTILTSLQKSGVDMVEIGMPFSDPLADGPVIQESSTIALQNGMSIKLLLSQLKNIREQIDIPLILMGYLNPILQYGVENFCKEAADCGVDGLIIPDLPLDEYLNEYKNVMDKHDLKNILLITPQTSDERIRLIDMHTDSFIYMVSSSSTTGVKSEISEQQVTYFNRIRQLNLKNPTVIGFGISDAQSFTTACSYANGAIIGSAFVTFVKKSNSLPESVSQFVSKIKGK